MERRYFVYDFDNGHEFFVTEAEALAYAEDVLASYRQEAHEGWNEDVELIIVGKVTHHIEKCNVITRTGDLNEDGYDGKGVYWGSAEYDEMNDYRLVRRADDESRK